VTRENVSLQVGSRKATARKSIRRIEYQLRSWERYPQGFTFIYESSVNENMDAEHPLEHLLIIPDDVVVVDNVKLWLYSEPYRVYSKGAAAGGGVAQTSEATIPPAVTSGPSSKTTDDNAAGPQVTIGPPSGSQAGSATHSHRWFTAAGSEIAVWYESGKSYLSSVGTYAASSSGETVAHIHSIEHTHLVPGDFETYVETRYFRSDQHTINGLTAYKFLTSKSGTQGSLDSGMYEVRMAVDFYYRIIKRSSGGSETVLLDWTLHHTRTTTGSGEVLKIQSISEVALDAGDAIRVDIRVVKNSTQERSWITDVLGATGLFACSWYIYLYTYNTQTSESPPYYQGGFRYDGTYNSRVECFAYKKTLANAGHSHGMSHTHNIPGSQHSHQVGPFPSHQHDLVFGIEDKAWAGAVINMKIIDPDNEEFDLGTIGTGVFSLEGKDYSRYFQKPGTYKLQFSTGYGIAHIRSMIYVQAFIQPE